MPTAMTCRPTVRHMMDYIEGRLSARARASLEVHLRKCPRCREFLDAYRHVPAIVRRATRAPMPQGSRQRVQQFVTRLHASRRWKKGTTPS